MRKSVEEEEIKTLVMETMNKGSHHLHRNHTIITIIKFSPIHD